MNNSRGKRSSIPQKRRSLTLLSQLCRHPDVGVRNRRSLRFLPPLEMSPSSIATNPAESREAPPTPQYPSTLRDTLGSSLKSPAEVEGNDFFPPQPEKYLESPSSTRLEALVPSHYSRATTRSSSLRAGRPDFPGAAREAP